MSKYSYVNMIINIENGIEKILNGGQKYEIEIAGNRRTFTRANLSDLIELRTYYENLSTEIDGDSFVIFEAEL